MSDETTAQPPRVRVNASQTAKGIWQTECTVEVFDGSSPVPRMVEEIKAAQAALKGEGYKLASDAA